MTTWSIPTKSSIDRLVSKIGSGNYKAVTSYTPAKTTTPKASTSPTAPKSPALGTYPLSTPGTAPAGSSGGFANTGYGKNDPAYVNQARDNYYLASLTGNAGLMGSLYKDAQTRGYSLPALPMAMGSAAANNTQNIYGQLPYPEMPNVNLQYPEVNQMTPEEALRQAQGILGPQFNMSRNNLLNNFQQEKARLPQVLNARGQLHGGLREGGEVELNQRQNMGLEQLALQNQASQADLANSLRMQDFQRAQGIADREFSAQQALANMAMDKWRAETDHVWRQNDARQSALQRAIDYENQQKAAAVAAQQKADDREFEMWKARLPWEMGPTPAQMLPYEQATANARLPYENLTALQALRQATGGGSGGGGGGSGGGSYYSGGVNPKDKVTSKDARAYMDAIKSGKMSIHDAVQNVYNNQRELQLAGVNVPALVNELRNAFGYPEY